MNRAPLRILFLVLFGVVPTALIGLRLTGHLGAGTSIDRSATPVHQAPADAQGDGTQVQPVASSVLAPEEAPVVRRSELVPVIRAKVQLEGPVRYRVTPMWGGRHPTLEIEPGLWVVLRMPEGVNVEDGTLETVTGLLMLTNNAQRELVERPVADGGKLSDPTRETPLALYVLHMGADPTGEAHVVSERPALERLIGAQTLRVAGDLRHGDTADLSRPMLVLENDERLVIRTGRAEANALREIDGRRLVLEGRLALPTPAEADAIEDLEAAFKPTLVLEVSRLP